MEGKDEVKDSLIVDEEAKKEFLEELRNKNLEETQEIERAKILAALKESNSTKEEFALDGVKDTKTDIEETKIDIVEDKKDRKKTPEFWLRNFKASIIDTAVTALLSVAALFLFDLILRFPFGYYVADLKGVYIIIFLIILIVYPPIMYRSKHGKTIGEKFRKREEQKGEE